MGGNFWRDNGDGTFSGVWDVDYFHYGAGFSWLDLYAMGLAEASEVPDMFILRDLHPADPIDRFVPRTGEKEIVTIEQVVAAEGPRIPSAEHSQKDFNTGFVYLLDSGQSPTTDLLRLHADYIGKVADYWHHITGRRSRITNSVRRRS